MSELQTCPHCGQTNRVAGLFEQGPISGPSWLWVTCWNCRQRFEAVPDGRRVEGEAAEQSAR